MELPRNTTLVGEVHPKQKIYVEDYVISYLRQIHKDYPEKEIGVALYGKKTMDEEETYYFLYGAVKMDSLVREVKHFSQAQLQEIEKMRNKFFHMYRFCGICMVREDEPEEIMLYEDSHLEAVRGYVRFYEKNDQMLELLLADREGSSCEGAEDMGRYETARSRQKERKEYYYPDGNLREKKKETGGEDNISSEEKTGGWWAVALCGAALFFLFTRGKNDLSGSFLAKLDSAYQSVKASVSSTNMAGDNMESERESTENVASAGDFGNKTLTEVGAIVTDEALEQVLLEENQKGKDIADGAAYTNLKESENKEDKPGTEKGNPTLAEEEKKETEKVPDEEKQKEQKPVQEDDQKDKEEQKEEPEAGEESKKPETYVICKGDTLIGISMSRYGTMQKVNEICKLNRIDNPDNIQIGQKILLP